MPKVQFTGQPHKVMAVSLTAPPSLFRGAAATFVRFFLLFSSVFCVVDELCLALNFPFLDCLFNIVVLSLARAGCLVILSGALGSIYFHI